MTKKSKKPKAPKKSKKPKAPKKPKKPKKSPIRLRLKNGRFASATVARAERNKFFHRALLHAIAAFKRAGFDGEVEDVTINERIINLYEPIDDPDLIIAIARQVETARLFPDIIYNISFQDTTGRWFAATKAWETVELATTEIVENIREQMKKYRDQIAAKGDDDEDYAIVAVMVSVYKYRR